MSKRALAERQHDEAAKFSGRVTNKNEIELGEENENHTSKNEKPSDVDS
jgi:hypothetical protein